MVKLQLARAAVRASKDIQAKFHRIVWAPSLWTITSNTDKPPTEIMRHPLEVLAKFDQQLATDKIEGDSLSKFVDFLNQHLSVITSPRPITLSLPNSGGDVRLFLYHSPEDSGYALTLAEALQQRKLETLFPAFDGPESDIKSFNSKQLTQCDGVILCWASASEVWVRAQASACAIGLRLDAHSNFAIEPWLPLRLRANERRRASCYFPLAKLIWLSIFPRRISRQPIF